MNRLLEASSHESTSGSMALLYSSLYQSITWAVRSDTIAGVLPSASRTLPPWHQNTDQKVVLESPQWLMAMPTGLPCRLRVLPCRSSSSHVFGYSSPAFAKCAMLYVAGNATQNHGTARQPEPVRHDSAAKGYQPPYFLPSVSTSGPTSTSRFSKRNGSAWLSRSMSWPDWLWASAARLAGSCNPWMVSTLTVSPACLPNASACRRSSSSEAGTKWLVLRSVSSRF